MHDQLLMGGCVEILTLVEGNRPKAMSRLLTHGPMKWLASHFSKT